MLQTEIYKLYGKAYGWYSLLSLCFFWASEQSTNILTSWWLSQWTTSQILYQIRRALGMYDLSKLMTCLACFALTIIIQGRMSCIFYMDYLNSGLLFLHVQSVQLHNMLCVLLLKHAGACCI